MDSYPWPTDKIAIFHSLSNFGTAMGRYPKIVLIISCQTFFFNRKMAYSSSVSTFIASASNSIMKLAVFFFSCLKDSILHSASAAFVLSLNVVLISLTKSSQFWISSFFHPIHLASSKHRFLLYLL